MRQLPKPVLLLVLLAALGALGGCRRSPADRLDIPENPPIVFISIDTLRSDRLPAYGYQGVETPAIDALRQDAILFERAYSHVPMTFPSHASIFTGRLPTVHGVRDNVGYNLDSKKLPYLPRLLKERGYATGGAISAFVMRGEVGFSEGFDFYDDKIESRVSRGISGLQRAGRDTLARATGWLQGALAAPNAERPFFLFLHIYEPHAPYAPPEPFRSRYRQLYDGEVAASDQVVGELVAELKRLGVYDRALVVLFSDHGEGLGEHGEDGHGVFLYRHDLQVPLLVKLPGAQLAGTAVQAPAGLVDLFPTVLQLLDVEKMPEDLDGASLLDLLEPEEGAPVRSLYAETYSPRVHFGWSELTSLIEDRFQYIHGPDPELYDLQADPAELTNLVQGERRVFAEMRQRLEGRLVPLAPPAAVDQETRQALAALGYVGTAASGLTGPLPDPKKMIPTLGYLHEGLEQFAKQRHAEAAANLRKAVDANPNMVDGWDYLGRSYQRLRRYDDALRAFKQAMKLSGGLPELALSTAVTLVEVGRPDEALLVLRHQVEKSPEDLRLRFLQTRLLLVLQRPQEAAAQAEEVLRIAPDNADANYQRGSVRMGARDFVQAEADFRRALEIDPNHPGTLSDYAVLLTLQGRLPEARTLLEKLVALRPNDAVAAANLDRVRAQMGG
jgi:arylsulfatase A-like enzyme/Flp pilus assembly protein TadD